MAGPVPLPHTPTALCLVDNLCEHWEAQILCLVHHLCVTQQVNTSCVTAPRSKNSNLRMSMVVIVVIVGLSASCTAYHSCCSDIHDESN